MGRGFFFSSRRLYPLMTLPVVFVRLVFPVFRFCRAACFFRTCETAVNDLMVCFCLLPFVFMLAVSPPVKVIPVFSPF